MDYIMFRAIFKVVKKCAKSDPLKSNFNAESYPDDMNLRFTRGSNDAFDMSVQGRLDKDSFRKFLHECFECKMDADQEYATLSLVFENCGLVKLAKVLQFSGIHEFNFTEEKDLNGKSVKSKITFLRKYSTKSIVNLLDLIFVDSK